MSYVPVILERIYSNINVCDRFSKIIQISHFIKIRPVGAELSHEDGLT
jgi:hypothetical protein